MDEDDEDRNFSRDIVVNYFEQAETTFASMDSALYVLNLAPQVESIDIRMRSS